MKAGIEFAKLTFTHRESRNISTNHIFRKIHEGSGHFIKDDKFIIFHQNQRKIFRINKKNASHFGPTLSYV